MTVKTIILKSGENLISDVKEGFLGEKLICYILENPHELRVNGAYKVLDDEDGGTNKLSISFQPWPLFTNDSRVEISCDSVVTITNPTEDIKKMYQEQVIGNQNEINKNSPSNEQSDSNQSN